MSTLRTLALAACLFGGIGSGHAATQSFNVFAQANSTAWFSQDASPLDTGLSFSVGSALQITASGIWNGGGCGDVGPSGTTCFGVDPTTGFNYFSLVGKVGSSGTWFRVSDAYDGVATSSGDLFLAFLDNDSFNNSGFVTAVVTTAVPEPAAWALLLGGAGLLAAQARRRARTAR